MRITWTTRANVKEGLYLTHEGFHPGEVPQKSIVTINRQGTWSNQLRVVTVELDANSAHLPGDERSPYSSKEAQLHKIEIH
jgi:hypothetical protein